MSMYEYVYLIMYNTYVQQFSLQACKATIPDL